MAQIRGKRDNRANRERALQNQVSAAPPHHHRADGAHQFQTQEEPTSDHCLANANVAHAFGAFAKFFHFIALASEKFDEQCAAHVERLVHHRVHLHIEIELLIDNLAKDASDPARRQNEYGEHHERQNRQAPFKRKHDRECDGDLERAGDDRDERVGDRALRADHIVIEPRHQVAGLGIGKKAQRHGLHVRVQRLA